jgi:hypothetical protein
LHRSCPDRDLRYRRKSRSDRHGRALPHHSESRTRRSVLPDSRGLLHATGSRPPDSIRTIGGATTGCRAARTRESRFIRTTSRVTPPLGASRARHHGYVAIPRSRSAARRTSATAAPGKSPIRRARRLDQGTNVPKRRWSLCLPGGRLRQLSRLRSRPSRTLGQPLASSIGPTGLTRGWCPGFGSRPRRFLERPEAPGGLPCWAAAPRHRHGDPEASHLGRLVRLHSTMHALVRRGST